MWSEPCFQLPKVGLVGRTLDPLFRVSRKFFFPLSPLRLELGAEP